MATLLRRDPFHLMDAFFGGDALGAFAPAAPAFVPSFEVRETKDAYVFRADVPGIPEKDLVIQMTGNVLTISGERKQDDAPDGERYFAYERSYGQFSRSFSLPDSADGERATADVKDGVLTLRVPKKPEVQARRIAIGSPSAQS
ncbi:MAG TPA: Hsp20/alpha crystallin family protein [Polyangia bacterium]|nr:Hsp20/alpha crystallin family protein [Polyangia bacterium]